MTTDTDRKKALSNAEIEDEAAGFDFGVERSDQREANLDDTQNSLRLMIDELTEEAVENTKSREFKIEKSMIDELVPLYKVELEDDEEEYEEPRRFRFEILIPIILALIALAAGLYAMFGGNDKPAPEPADDETAVELIEETPEPTDDPDEIQIQELCADVEDLLDGAEGTWSVYLKNLDTGKKFVINDSQMQSASLIKLFTAGRYLEMLDNGELYESDASAWDLTAMISWSDNDAWQELETIIGFGDYNSGLISVTDFAQRHGFVNSGRLIGADSIYDPEADNLTSAAEIGAVLEQIENRTFVCEEASERLKNLMELQTYINKIPAGLPQGFDYASKSGEWAGIENDAAIIKGPDTDYILVVLSNDIYDSESAVDLIVRISNLCALRLNPSVE